MRRRTFLAVAGAAGLVGLSGCGGDGATVSGEITYDGLPVKKGKVTFTPKSGKGQPAGGDITDGRYSVKGVAAGVQIVNVSSVDESAKPISTDDMMNAAKDPEKKKKLPPGGIFILETIPPNAVGNNAEFEVTGGSMTKDFHLTKPAK